MAGDHCQFCKVKATCRKRAEYNLELAQYDFEMPPTLEETEVAAILPKIDSLIHGLRILRNMLCSRLCLVLITKGSRLWKAEPTGSTPMMMQLLFAAKDAGFDPYEKKLLGITAMTALMGKKKFEEVLGKIYYKASGQACTCAGIG